MRQISLQEACEIVKTIHTERPGHFWYMAGAGVAAPLVPLARDIILSCGGDVPDSAQRSDGEAWAKCFSEALLRRYPTRSLQRSFISQLTNDDGPISEASYLLGYQLASCSPASFLCTTNFDRMIARVASMLSTKMVSIGENPADAPKFDVNEYKTPQLLHIHGVAWAYDIKALYRDVKNHSKDVSELLRSLIDNRPLMVIGYSGWESDVFMTALREVLDKPAPLKQVVIWFVYKHSDFDSLPKWLRDSGDPAVVFVMPEVKTAQHINDPVLDAAVVLNAISNSISLAPPWLVSNPIMFTAHRIRSMIDGRKTGGNQKCAALPAARQTIQILLRAARREKHATQQRTRVQEFQSQITNMFNENRLDEVVDKVLAKRSGVILKQMASPNLDYVWTLLDKCGARIIDNSPSAFRLYEAGEKIASAALKKGDHSESAATLWRQRGYEYCRRKLRWYRINGGLNASELLESYRLLTSMWSKLTAQGSSDPDHVNNFAKCLLGYAQVYGQLEKWKDSRLVAERALRLFQGVVSDSLGDSKLLSDARLFTACAIQSVALALLKQGEVPAAQAMLDDLAHLSSAGDIEIDHIREDVRRMVFDHKKSTKLTGSRHTKVERLTR